MNVLLLEDEVELSAVAVEQLEMRGYTVFPALTLEEARRILEVNEPAIDILIADHRIPDGSGVHFAIATKGISRDLKVVVVSGCLSIENVEELEAHNISYFNKPLRYAEIFDELIETHFN